MARPNVLVLLAVGSAFTACGGGRPDFAAAPGTSSVVTVHLSAGTPVAGATVTVYAARDATGEVDTQVGTAGVIGIGGPTDASGDATITLSMPNYSGPIQITASGSSLSYVDPAMAAASGAPGTAPPVIQIPSGFVFSSFLASYAAGTTVKLPVNLLTTIASHEALAYAKGRHPAHPGAKRLSVALAERDRLFVQHIVNSPTAWDPSTLRTTVPAALTAGPATMTDTAYAAFFDLALASLAHSTATQAGFPPGSTAITAITLAQLLLEDVDADAMFDGRGQGGVQLLTQGTTPLQLNSQYLRIPLAAALDQWVQSKSGNATGIKQADLISTGVYSSISGDASDLFGQAPVGLYNPVDRVPPEVTLVGEPATFVKPGSSSIQVTINATDPSGVAQVWCATGIPFPSAIAATENSDGTWSCAVGLNRTGATSFAIWADDLAFPANSGKGNPDQRYQLTRTVTVDGSAPTATIVESLQSFRNELGMTVNVDAAGKAVVPPQFAYAQPLITIKDGTSIYKASSRLGWLSAPTTTTLEGANPDNVPTVQYAVPYDALVDAPVTTATWSVTIDGAPQPSATGDLWPAGSNPGALLYDLPLSVNLIPALASVTGPASIAVMLTLGDAAGNVRTQSGGNYTYHLIGSPIAISEDTTYSATADIRSAFPYKVSDALYAQLFQDAAPAFLPEDAVRLVKYTVTNPSSSPVALALPRVPGGWSARESWAGVWVPTGTSTDCGDPDVGPSGDMTVTVATSDLVTFAYNQLSGIDTSPAQKTASGQVIIPPATASYPGALTLYVGRPLFPGLRTYPLTWTGSKFENAAGTTWVATAVGPRICCDYDEVRRRCLTYGRQLDVTIYNVFQDLTAGDEILTGTFTLVTQGLSGTGTVGEPASSAATVAVDRTIHH